MTYATRTAYPPAVAPAHTPQAGSASSIKSSSFSTKSSPENHARAFSHIAYRADIDGLRAIAVLAVVALHMQIRYALGGFIGVDVFFVLSGYLITSILLADMDTGRFTLRNFYTRRIRRIYPALIAVMLATTVVSLIVCMPSELRDYAHSLIAVSLSVSNIYFGLHAGYFEAQSGSRPALQTWSLGVEEQFYLVFPILLVLLRRWVPQRLALALGALAALSFASSIFGVLHSPSLAYFMPWTRACELLCGSMLALNVIPRTSSRAWRNLAAIVGLLIILGGILLLNGAIPFPGVAALIPCGGTALLIWSGQPQASAAGSPLPPPTLVGRLLSARPVVFVGLISYSLYLWHWPLIIFQRLGLLGEGLPPHLVKLVILLLSFVLATLSWHYVERPFRDGKFRLTSRQAFTFATVSSALLIAAGIAALALHGLPGRFPRSAVAISRYVDETPNNRLGSCMVIRPLDFKPNPCLSEDPSRPNWLLFGDSHAAAQWTGLDKAYPSVHFLQMSSASCRPDPARTSGTCGQLTHPMFTTWLPAHHIDRMIVVGRWVEYDIPAINRLVAWTAAHHIPLTLIGPTQDYDAPLPRLLAYGILRHDPGFADRHLAQGTAELDSRLAELARTRWHVPYISLVRMFCKPSGCDPYLDAGRTIPLLLDDDHLSNEGSLAAGRLIARQQLLPQPTPLSEVSLDTTRHAQNR